MNTNLELSQRLREVFLDGKWIANTNYKSEISTLNWQEATKKIGNLNTIAALTFHINYYTKGLLHVFEGGLLEIKDNLSFAMPLINSQESWNALVEEFITNATQFVNTIAQMPNEKFEEPFIEKKYGTNRRNIEGVLEHSYYHLGQITLIKKLLLNNKAML